MVEDVKKRAEKLRKLINYHRYLYHVLNKQEISDEALDALKKELFDLEQKYPQIITPDSPTQRVEGKILEKFNKVTHSKPMLSLFDAFTEKDMIDWEERFKKVYLQNTGKNFLPEYYCELKLDGLAISLVYENGFLKIAATRGDGKIGEDVTNNIKTIESIPLALPDSLKNKKIEIRGEAIMTKKVFEKLNQELKKQNKPLLANTRNAAAGSLRQLDSSVVAQRKLDFYAYDIFGVDMKTREEADVFLKKIGFKTVDKNKKCKNLKEVFSLHHNLDENKEKLDFHCDGVVVKINNLADWEILGIVGKAPRYMVAYKFKAAQAVSKVLEVNWQVGRTGTLTPVATLDPVEIYGVTISHATLHNLDEIERLDVEIGDTVILERAGDVIPKIIKVLKELRDGKEEKIKIPKFCPSCSSGVIRQEGEVALRCSSKNCFAVNLRNLIHWSAKSAANIEGLGPRVIEQLVKNNLINNISDIYKLEKGELLSLEGFADKAAENLINAIHSSKEIELQRFIYALGIRHVGEETANDLAGLYQDKDSSVINFYKKIKNLNLEKLQEIKDMGPIVARSIYDWFHDKHNESILEKLEKNGVKIKIQENDFNNQELKNKIFVLTGALIGLTRDEAKDRIRKLGGDIASSVSKKTDYLVAGENTGLKYKKAKDLGIKIISEEEFKKIIQL